MKKQKVTDIFLYRWRYVFGYTLLALLYIGAIIVSALHIPGGLSQAEIDMVNTTNHLNFSIEGIAVTNLPFHLLQLLFFKLFGVSLLTIKAPAVILSIASSVAIFFLLKRWFKPSTTILSLLIMATTGQFLFIGQSATVGILYIFYTALTLLFATLILQKAQNASIWRISLAITTALSLFTPYFWYINLGLLIIAFLHPHPRYFLISRKHRKSWIVPFSILFVMVCGINFLCYKSRALFYNLIGINSLSFDIVANLRTLYYTYIRIFPSVVGNQITPIMDINAMVLIGLGLFRSFQKISSARSFMIWSWLILALALLIFQPSLTPIIIIPLFILLAVGLESLMNMWYGLFPRNPYARGTGLVLISMLIIVMAVGGSFRYIDGYRYFPEAVSRFNKDLSLLRKNTAPTDSFSLLVSREESPIYEALKKHSYHQISIIHTAPANVGQTLYVSHSVKSQIPQTYSGHLSSVIVNDHKDGDRFYIYTSDRK
jgi:hypothetical protein